MMLAIGRAIVANFATVSSSDGAWALTSMYLMQHGQATEEAEDAARPLTEAGRARWNASQRRAKAANVRIDRCLHSGKLRAEQTAEMLGGAVGSEAGIEPRDGLAPNDPVAPVADWLGEAADGSSIALVGHLPFLDRLASLLISDDENRHVIQFRMGGLVKLVPKSEGPGFAVAWILTPEFA